MSRLTIVQRDNQWIAFAGPASSGKQVKSQNNKRPLVAWAKKEVDTGKYTEAHIYTASGKIDEKYETRHRSQINSLSDLQKGDKLRGVKGGVTGGKWVVVEPGEYTVKLQRMDRGRRRDQYRKIGQSDFHKYEVSNIPEATRRHYKDYEKEGGYRIM